MPRNQSHSGTTQVPAIILASARREIEKHGILGLRVAEVAAGANSALTQIYRYFGDRNGLLAAVLSQMYEEIQEQSFDSVMKLVAERDPLTIDAFVDCIPSVTDPETQKVQALRLQILAAAVTNEVLHRRLTEVTRRVAAKWEEGIATVRRRLPEGTPFDTRVFMMLALQMPYYRTLMGPEGFSDAEYKGFIRDALSRPPL